MYVSSKEMLGKQIHTVCSDQNLAIIDQISDIQNISFAVKMESYAIALLTQGAVSFVVDGETYNMTAGQMFIFRPNIRLDHPTTSPDAQYTIMVLTQQYAQSLIAMDGRNTWDILLYISGNPVITLTTDQIESLQKYSSLLRRHLMLPNANHHQDIVNHIFLAALYEFHNIIEQYINVTPYQFSNAEVTFRQFYDILNNATPKRHKVEYFARQLNITPKYLSAICKQITGKSALQLITDAVLKEITTLLRDERISIKEIAQLTGFPNQSFLGSYTRKHLGMSPHKYRIQLLGGQTQ